MAQKDFLAHFDGKCQKCGGDIRRNITRVKHSRAPGVTGTTAHLECYFSPPTEQRDYRGSYIAGTKPTPRPYKVNGVNVQPDGRPMPGSEQPTPGGGIPVEETPGEETPDIPELETPEETPDVAAIPTPSKGAVNPMQVLATALAPYMTIDRAQVLRTIDEKLGAAGIETLVQVAVKEGLENHTRRVIVEWKKPDGGKTEVDMGKQHPKFTRLVKWANRRENIYLYGAAGWGKSTAAVMLAKAIKTETYPDELPFYYIALNNQSSAHRVEGFLAADGKTFSDPDFFKAYCNGGVFLIDEIDAANGNLLTAINGALANGHANFAVGMRKKHEDFICVATGNTTGRGGSAQYNARMPLDAATLDRFVFIDWHEDNEFERDNTLAINPKAGRWVSYMQKLREYCKVNFPKNYITPRMTYRGAMALADGDTPEQFADEVIFRGLEADSVTKILNNNPLPKVF